jgi:hypothetical protein
MHAAHIRSHTKNCKYRPFLLAVNAKEVRHGRAESLVDGNQKKQQEMPVQKRKIRDFFIDSLRLALICLVSHHHSRTVHHAMLHHTRTHHSHAEFLRSARTAPLFPTSTRSPTIGPLHFEPVAMITVLRQQSLCCLSFCEIWSSLITEIYEQIMKFYCISQAATRKHVVSPKILGGGVKKELKDAKRYVPYSRKRC